MNGRNAKMLRRLEKDNPSGKQEFMSMSSTEKYIVRCDYIDRGDVVRKQYSENKKKAKVYEQVSNC